MERPTSLTTHIPRRSTPHRTTARCGAEVHHAGGHWLARSSIRQLTHPNDTDSAALTECRRCRAAR